MGGSISTPRGPLTAVKPRRTEVVLFQGGDFDRIEQQALEVKAAAQTSSRSARLGDDDMTQVRAAAVEYDDLVKAAVERGESVIVVALPRKAFRALVVGHPARVDNDQDKTWGFDYEAMADSLVPLSVPLFDPDTERRQFESEDDRQAWLDSLSDGDFSRIYSAAIKVNQGSTPDPFVSLSGRLGPTSPESSEPPERLG